MRRTLDIDQSRITVHIRTGNSHVFHIAAKDQKLRIPLLIVQQGCFDAADFPRIFPELQGFVVHPQSTVIIALRLKNHAGQDADPPKILIRLQSGSERFQRIAEMSSFDFATAPKRRQLRCQLFLPDFSDRFSAFFSFAGVKQNFRQKIRRYIALPVFSHDAAVYIADKVLHFFFKRLFPAEFHENLPGFRISVHEI